MNYINSTCHCRDYINGRWRTLGCLDTELLEECKRAEWEMVDWVNAVMRYTQTFVQAHPSDAESDSSNMAHLSYAIEINRPVPDCATGLFTKHRIGSRSCFSLELLEQCEYVKDNIGYYMSDVITQLENRNATTDFVDIIRKRVTDSIVPTITCQTTEDVDSNDSSTLEMNESVIILLISILLIYFYF